MATFSLKLPEALMRRLDQEAGSRRVTRSTLVREVLAKALEKAPENEVGSCYDLARDLAGSIQGMSKDLATNPKHMEHFGR